MNTGRATRRAFVAAAVLVLTALTLAGCHSTPTPTTVDAPVQVHTSSGELRGTTAGTARQFLGVRYAAPPVGDRRWTLPEPAPEAAGVVDATHAGTPCAQAGAAPGAGATASTDEDCLFLNVTTPKRLRSGDALPVMVWWHGGGFTSGSGAAYDAQRLATTGDVVVVTVNYRLGIFGYLGLPGLAGSGDFGLADQILATRWARDNAAAFGGDPHNVTVFGQSAGAISACALLTSPAAAGLVEKVAMQSGGTCQLDWPRDGLLPTVPAGTAFVSLTESESIGSATAAQLGCAGDALGCLRALPTKSLLGVSGLFSNVLAYGTDLLPRDPVEAVSDGDVAAGVRVLSTGTQAEQRAFVGGVQQAAPTTYTATTYPQLLTSAYGADAGRVLAQYPLSAYPTAAVAFATVVTDSSWACPTLAGNAALAAHGTPVFNGEFRDPSPPNVNGVTTPEVPQGPAHADDVPYLFDLTGKSLLTTAAQRRLASQMVGYWTSFARTGTPSAAGAPAWPALTGTGGPTLGLGPDIAPVDVGTEHRCEFWSTVDWPGRSTA